MVILLGSKADHAGNVLAQRTLQAARQKTLSNLPKVVSESQAAGEKLGAKLGLEAMQEVMSEHPELKQEMEDAQKSRSR